MNAFTAISQRRSLSTGSTANSIFKKALCEHIPNIAFSMKYTYTESIYWVILINKLGLQYHLWCSLGAVYLLSLRLICGITICMRETVDAIR